MYLGQGSNFMDEFNIEEGDYYLIAEVDWIEATKDKSFAVTVYSENKVIFEDITDTVDKAKIMMKWGESNFKC